MKKSLLVVAWYAVFLTSAGAQFAPQNEAGLTMGHVHMIVRDVEAARKFWVDQVGATPVKVGQAQAVKMDGMLVVFRQGEPTGPLDGSVINHIGLTVPSLTEPIARFTAAGTAMEKPRMGPEKLMQMFVTGPDQFRLELTENPAARSPLAAHHLHYNVVSPIEVQDWYVRTLFLKAGKRAQWDAADVPGMNLTFASVPQNRPTVVPTKGRLLDHFGIEVKNLAAFSKKLEAAGVKLDSPYRQDPELGVASVFLTDPWGTSIELTEGLNTF